MMELLGKMPKNMAQSGKHSKKFFNSRGSLRRIQGLNYWPLKKVLVEKYHFKEDEAEAFANFLFPMLSWYPWERATARKMLDHEGLRMADNYDYKLTDKEYEVMMLKKQLKSQVKGNGGNPVEDDTANQEMNELVESEEERYAADFDLKNPSDSGHGMEMYDSDSSQSLCLSADEKQRIQKRKEKDAKINNSFTGPYPLDPTDFNHTDKGPNF